jgi:hypothetical protein
VKVLLSPLWTNIPVTTSGYRLCVACTTSNGQAIRCWKNEETKDEELVGRFKEGDIEKMQKMWVART